VATTISGYNLKEVLATHLSDYLENSHLDEQMKNIIIKLLHNKGKILNNKETFVWSEFYLLYSLVFLNSNELEEQLSIAAAIELLILATDIMDEISDNEINGENLSKLGIPKGLTIANALLIEAFAILLKSKCHLNLAFDELRKASIGQWRDISFVVSEINIPTEQEYFNIINMKSSSLVRLLFRLSNCDIKDTNLVKVATNIGLAGQLKNDAQDIFTPDKNDLFQLKATLPLIKALEYSTQFENGSLMRKLISLKETQSIEMHTNIQTYIKRVGSIDYTLVLSRMYMNSAITSIKKYENSYNRNNIEFLINYLIR